MNGPALVYAVRWLVRDTFRQALAGKVFWYLLALSILCIVFCLGVSIEGGVVREEGEYFAPGTNKPLAGPNPEPGTMRLLFGAFNVPIARGAREEVHLIQVVLGTWVAGTLGLLLTLIWTAGFLPDFLQPASASVLLAKPAPRWAFLLGKYFGVLIFVALHSFIFFFGTWLALGIKTGIWNGGYLWGCPLLVLQFAGLYSFSILLAVVTRSTITSVLGILVFWALCVGLNYGRHAAVSLPVLAPGTQMPGFTLFLIDACYWILPKPADMLLLLEDALGAGGMKTTLSGMAEFQAAQQLGRFDPVLSLLSVAVFAAIMLALASYQLEKTDY